MPKFEDMGILEMCKILGDMGKELKRDPLNDMSVKDYNLMKIKEKKDQLVGARKYLFEAMNLVTEIEKELLDLLVEQVEGYKLPEGRNCPHCKGTLYESGDQCSC